MSSMGKTTGLVGAQVIFTPVQTPDVEAAVESALKVIHDFPLSIETNAMATLIRGDLETILEMVGVLYKTMDSQGVFTLDLRLSNTCGI